MIDGFVLAGGRSSRMGTDKARMDVDGVPMAVRVVLALDAACDRVALIRRHDDGPWLRPDGRAIRVVFEDDAEPVHPLWGLATAAAAAQAPVVLIAPCDLPDLLPEHVRALCAAEPPAVAWDGDRVHPLLGVWPVAVGPAAAAAARAGTSVHAFATAARRVALPAWALRNVNAPGDATEVRPGPRGGR